MKNRRVHFCWAIVTALAAAVSARIAAPPESTSPPHVCRAPAAVAATPKPEEAPKVEAPDLPEIPISVPAADPVKDGSAFLARLRALFKTDNGWNELQTLADDVANRPALLDALKLILNEPDYQGKYYALAVLRLLKGRESAKILEDYLAQRWARDDGTASNAASALGEVGDTLSLPVLNQALHSKSEDVRLSCAEALLRLGFGGPAGDIVASMTRQFESSDGALRKKAIENIVRLNHDAALPMLVRGLRDSNGDVRVQAIWGISSLGRLEYVALVSPLVNDPNPEVAEAAKNVVQSADDEK